VAARSTWGLDLYYYRNTVNDVARRCHPGDEVRAGKYGCPPGAWQALAERLAARGLTLLGFGKCFFVLPAHPRTALLPGLARGAGFSAIRHLAGGLTLESVLAEVFAGAYPATLRRALVNACGKAPQDAAVPGGEPRPSALPRLQEQTAKLSKLQRGLLAWVATFPFSAPVKFVPAALRTSRAALSHAWRRLESRGLVTLEKKKGRLVNVTLTTAGQTVFPPEEDD
jgi:hypothetical protein